MVNASERQVFGSAMSIRGPCVASRCVLGREFGHINRLFIRMLISVGSLILILRFGNLLRGKIDENRG